SLSTSRRPPTSTLFPYTTLFRSHERHDAARDLADAADAAYDDGADSERQHEPADPVRHAEVRVRDVGDIPRLEHVAAGHRRDEERHAENAPRRRRRPARASGSTRRARAARRTSGRRAGPAGPTYRGTASPA